MRFPALHEKHLHRYLSEFDFRYSNRVALGVDDMERAEKMAQGIVGSASHIGGLTKPDFKRQAKRFLRWRKSRLRNVDNG